MKISSANKKILIISDSHNNWRKLKQIIDSENPDIVVFAGDHNDSFYLDNDCDVRDASMFHKELLNKENCIVLYGNHDISVYPGSGPSTKCSGYELRKDSIINSIFSINDWDKIKWHVVVDDWLVTHAGLLPEHIKNVPIKDINNIDMFLESESIIANRALKSGKSHWFWGAGIGRGGFARHAGIVWTDWEYEFRPINNIKQICGHSNGGRVRRFSSVFPDNICIDSSLNEWVIIQNGKMEVKKYIDL